MSYPYQPSAYTVTRLNEEVRDLLEAGFPSIRIEGEVSNLAQPASGHWYFSLKDARSQVRCAMFRGDNRRVGLTPRNGQHVLLAARVSLYPARGDFQLIVSRMEEYGEGALRQAFEALKHRLAEEGLFDASLKRPLPGLPHCVGLITSPTGAAVRDVLTVLGRRFPALPVRIYPVAVQGSEAAAEIVEALRLASQRADCDVLILARGGGSLEDLQPFNEEAVARAIRTCPIPVVTGVGHEVDVTIADFAADYRAATPSAAAEAVSPEQEEWRRRIDALAQRLGNLVRARLGRERERLEWLVRRLRHPRQRLEERTQYLDGLSLRLVAAQRAALQARRLRLQGAAARLQRQDPSQRLLLLRTRQAYLAQRLRGVLAQGLAQRRARLAALGHALEAVGPHATLERGYAMLTRHPDGPLVRSVGDAPPASALQAHLADGRLLCRVEGLLDQEDRT